MKKIDVLINSLIYLIYMVVSCIAIMIAEILILKVVNLFILPSSLTVCVLRALIYTIGVNALFAIASFREGYRAAYFPIIGTLISSVCATLVHFIYALLFGFEAFAAGGVKFIAALIKFGSSLDSSTFFGKLGRIDMIPFFFINSLVYIAVMIIFGKIGEKMRLRDRNGLAGIDDQT